MFLKSSMCVCAASWGQMPLSLPDKSQSNLAAKFRLNKSRSLPSRSIVVLAVQCMICDVSMELFAYLIVCKPFGCCGVGSRTHANILLESGQQTLLKTSLYSPKPHLTHSSHFRPYHAFPWTSCFLVPANEENGLRYLEMKYPYLIFQ